MTAILTNPCTRCGRERILSKEWKEEIPALLGGTIVIVHRENICPDPECQKIVEVELNAQRLKKAKIQQEKDKRSQENLQKKNDLKLSLRKKN